MASRSLVFRWVSSACSRRPSKNFVCANSKFGFFSKPSSSRFSSGIVNYRIIRRNAYTRNEPRLPCRLGKLCDARQLHVLVGGPFNSERWSHRVNLAPKSRIFSFTCFERWCHHIHRSFARTMLNFC